MWYINACIATKYYYNAIEGARTIVDQSQIKYWKWPELHKNTIKYAPMNIWSEI